MNCPVNTNNTSVASPTQRCRPPISRSIACSPWRSSTIAGWIGNAGLGEARGAEAAGIAPPAGAPRLVGLIAGHRETVVHPQFCPHCDDLRLAEFDERRVDGEALSLHAGAGGQLRQPAEGLDEGRTAVRIARVVDGVDADENVMGLQHLRP